MKGLNSNNYPFTLSMLTYHGVLMIFAQPDVLDIIPLTRVSQLQITCSSPYHIGFTSVNHNTLLTWAWTATIIIGKRRCSLFLDFRAVLTIQRVIRKTVLASRAEGPVCVAPRKSSTANSPPHTQACPT